MVFKSKALYSLPDGEGMRRAALGLCGAVNATKSQTSWIAKSSYFRLNAEEQLGIL